MKILIQNSIKFEMIFKMIISTENNNNNNNIVSKYV